MTSRLATARGTVSATAAVGTARVFALGAAAAQLPFVARALDPDEFAFVAVAIAAAAYFSLCGAEATTLAFQRFPGTSEARANFRFARRRILRSLALLSLVVLTIATLVGHFDLGFALVGFGLGMAANRFVATAWLMWSEPWSYAGSLILGTGARVGVLLGALSVGASPFLAVGLAGIVSAVASLFFSPRTGDESLLSVSPWPRYLGLSLALASAAYALLTNFNLLALPYAVSDLDIARYAAMNQTATLSLGAVLGVAFVVLQPQALNLWNNGDQKAASLLIALACYGTLLLGGLSILATEMYGRQLLTAALGPMYFDRNLLHLMIASTSLAALGQFMSMSHVLQLEPGKVRNCTTIAALIGSIASLSGMLVSGVESAAAGMLLGFVIYVSTLWIGSATSWCVLVLGLSGAGTGISALWLEDGPVLLMLVSVQVGLAIVFMGTTWRTLRQPHG